MLLEKDDNLTIVYLIQYIISDNKYLHLNPVMSQKEEVRRNKLKSRLSIQIPVRKIIKNDQLSPQETMNQLEDGK